MAHLLSSKYTKPCSASTSKSEQHVSQSWSWFGCGWQRCRWHIMCYHWHQWLHPLVEGAAGPSNVCQRSGAQQQEICRWIVTYISNLNRIFTTVQLTNMRAELAIYVIYRHLYHLHPHTHPIYFESLILPCKAHDTITHTGKYTIVRT